MKKPAQISSLADRLTAAANTPTMPIAQPEAIPARSRGRPVSGSGSVSVFLRVPAELYAQLEGEATDRTRATGKGVTVQQVILSKLEPRL
jgi:hypothetical protein